jgi:hypothetical protein
MSQFSVKDRRERTPPQCREPKRRRRRSTSKGKKQIAPTNVFGRAQTKTFATTQTDSAVKKKKKKKPTNRNCLVGSS